jgi:hypothetical protein
VLLTARRVTTPTWRSDALLGLGMGTCLFWMGFCRQHAVVSAAAIGLYLLIHHRRVLAFSVAFSAVWAAALVAVSMHTFGTNIPPTVYQPGAIDGKDVLNRFSWLMISPSRGLLVYCPYLLVVGVMLLAFRRHIAGAGLLLPIMVAVGTHTAIFSAYNGWHAGTSYGPRYFCDVLPWFALATAIALRAAMDAPSVTRGAVRELKDDREVSSEVVLSRRYLWWKVTLFALLAAAFWWGWFVHSRGANSQAAWLWNFRALAVTEEGAVKEWRHPQFLCGITFKVQPDGSVIYGTFR